MKSIDDLIRAVMKQEHGFSIIQKEAEHYFKDNDVRNCISISKQLFSSDVMQARAMATFILGYVAFQSDEAVDLLKNQVSKDKSWQVQEILAKAFDQYCSDTGYEKALPIIKDWLINDSPNVRRAVTEGLRIWTSRPYFKDHPNETVELLSRLRDDESEYVRKSVGNALKDISKKHRDLIESEILTWDITDKRIRLTYKHASKLLFK